MKKSKYVISGFLIFIGFLLIYSKQTKEYVYIEDISESSELNLNFSLRESLDLQEIIKLNVDLSQDSIFPLIILSTKSCPQCITNTSEYIKLFESNSKFLNPVIFFIGNDINKIKHFFKTSGLNASYKILDSFFTDKIDLTELPQNIFFLNLNDQAIFYNKRIENRLTTLHSKREFIDEVLVLVARNQKKIQLLEK